jgi:hypothetical protein
MQMTYRGMGIRPSSAAGKVASSLLGNAQAREIPRESGVSSSRGVRLSSRARGLVPRHKSSGREKSIEAARNR